METFISIQDIVNIVTLVAPGYFALKTYSIIYNKPEKEFSQLILLSAIFSLPLVAAYSLIFGIHYGVDASLKHSLGVIVFAVVVGFIWARVRRLQLVRRLTRTLRLPVPEEDFLKLQFAKLSKDEYVIVKLKNGELFFGKPRGASKYYDDRPQRYSFGEVAWFEKQSKQWEDRPGSLIISLEEIEYFETSSALPED